MTTSGYPSPSKSSSAARDAPNQAPSSDLGPWLSEVPTISYQASSTVQLPAQSSRPSKM